MFLKNNWKIYLGLIVVIFLGSFYLFYKFNNKNLENTANVISTGERFLNSGVQNNVSNVEIKEENNLKNSFYHPQYKFSFIYPSHMNVSNFIEGSGEQILFQSKNGDEWFQIYVIPWDEGNNLSVARIKQDLPNLPIKESQEAILGPKQKDGVGPRALIFFSEEPGIGETREVWFVVKDNLYQVTTYKRLDSFLAEILSSLNFE